MAAESSGAMAMAISMLWRTVGFLSVTLEWQNFLVLSGGVPVVADRVTGRLGRPRPEIPEFWRAALDAAVQWGAEEFGFPPEAAEQVDGWHSGGAPPRAAGNTETEDSPLPEGLLRASGMRL